MLPLIWKPPVTLLPESMYAYDSTGQDPPDKATPKEKYHRKDKKGKGPCLPNWLFWLSIVAFGVVSFVGTLLVVWLLQPLEMTDDPRSHLYNDRAHYHMLQREGSRVLHLSLEGSDRKTRFVVPRNELWEDFVQGVQERLRLRTISRIETAGGEEIMSLDDVIDNDSLIVRDDTLEPTVMHVHRDSRPDEDIGFPSNDRSHHPRRGLFERTTRYND